MNIRKEEIIEAFLELYDWFEIDIQEYPIADDEHLDFAERMAKVRDRIKEYEKHKLHLWNQLHGR